MKTEYLLILLFSIVTATQTTSKHIPEIPKAKLILDLKPNQLDEELRTTHFAVVFYNRTANAKAKENLKMLKKLYAAFKDHELSFIQVIVPKNSPEAYQVYVYVNQTRKHYAGIWSYEALQNWVYEIFFARPRHKKSLKEIDTIDSHYFVYVDSDYKTKNEDEIKQLAKLLNPLAIIFGLEETELSALLKGRVPSSPLWIYREYRNEIISIDMDQPMQKISDFVIQNEFPDFIYPDQKSLRLLVEFKVPTLVYYTNDVKEEFVEVLKELMRSHKEYLILTIVDVKKKSKATRFLKNFMGVTKAPAIRILNMTDMVKRYKFIGKAQPLLITNFIHNYINGNLEAYTVNEELKKGERYNNIIKGNYKMFQKILKDVDTAYLVYVYGSQVKDTDHDFKVLDKLQLMLGGNLHFEIVAINHDKNDLDGYFNDALPFIFIATRKNTVEHYDGRIEVEDLLTFVFQQFPYFKVEEGFQNDEL